MFIMHSVQLGKLTRKIVKNVTKMQKKKIPQDDANMEAPTEMKFLAKILKKAITFKNIKYILISII